MRLLAFMLSTLAFLVLAAPARADLLADCEQAEDPELAVEACTAVIESEDSSRAELIRAYEKRAKTRAKAQEYVPALDDIDMAISLGSQDDEIFRMRGTHHAQFHEYESAIEDFDQALRLNPANRAVLIARGTVRNAMGAHEDAIEDYSEAIRLAARDAATFVKRSEAYAGAGRVDEAIVDLDEAIRIEPENSKHFNARASLHSWNGDHLDAIRDYSTSLELRPGSSAAYNSRGLEHKTLGNLDQAISDYTESIRLSDPMTAALIRGNRGMALMEAGRYEEAIGDFGMAASGQIMPRKWKREYRSLRASAQAKLARERYSEARYQEGMGLVEESLAMNWDDPFALATRGLIKAALGHSAEALEDFTSSTRTGGPQQVRVYQEALLGHGYDPGPVDGEWREETRAALEACLAEGCRLLD